jgi:hypothetical protein
MRKKQKPFILEPLIEFMTARITAPTKKEIDRLIKKTEQSLSSLKVPTKAEFDRLIQRVEALEKALKVRKGAGKVARPERPGKKAATKKKRVAKTKRQVTSSEKVLQVIRRYRTGVDVATLKTQTGLEDKKIRDIIFRLGKQGKIKRTGRGVYKVAM